MLQDPTYRSSPGVTVTQKESRRGARCWREGGPGLGGDRVPVWEDGKGLGMGSWDGCTIL